MELICEKVNWNQVQVLVEFQKQYGSDEVDIVVDYFPLSELENEYFIELLKYLLSYGKTEYHTWFEEFIYIPYEDGKPMSISDVGIRKIENGETYHIKLVAMNDKS